MKKITFYVRDDDYEKVYNLKIDIMLIRKYLIISELII